MRVLLRVSKDWGSKSKQNTDTGIKKKKSQKWLAELFLRQCAFHFCFFFLFFHFFRLRFFFFFLFKQIVKLSWLNLHPIAPASGRTDGWRKPVWKGAGLVLHQGCALSLAHNGLSFPVIKLVLIWVTAIANVIKLSNRQNDKEGAGFARSS